MKTKKPLTQLKVTVSSQEKPLSDFLTASCTFQYGDLLLNRKGLCFISEESNQPPDVKGLDMQFIMEDFEIIKVIGQGSGGVVQLIRHKFMGTLFALKSIQMNIQETVRKEEIAQELKINQDSLCPHVVFCYHSFYHNGIISMVLEYMDRGSIADIIKQVKTILEPYLAVLCQQVLKGLVYLHNERHIIHRDIKPSHLLVNHKGEVKIAGFGVSTVLASSMDQSDTFVGTYYYMAPERISGSSYGFKSDIWSLGLVILECATGSFPYKQTENEEGPLCFYELLETIEGEPPPSVSEDHFSPEFCSFISACLQKDPQQRMSSLELLSHPFIKKFEDKDIDLGILFEQAIKPPENSSGVDDAVIYGKKDDKKNLLLSDDCKGIDISLIQSTSETTSKVGDTVIYGREDDKKKVIKLLLSDECSELDISLIQITGTGGIGKSTLAYLVYRDPMICDYFDMKAWVHMPESIDIGRILNAIIESLTGISCYVTELNELYEIIGEELSGKRFLIVLDNLRNGAQSFWRSFMRLMVSLSIGAKGSIIMVTTRTEIISDLMRSIRPYHLNNLSDEHCFSIFADYAFDKQEPCIFPELMRTGKHIVAKCEGIPLAAKAVGSLLHFNENNLPPDSQCWKDVLESALWESDECFPAISLCYDYLPLHMKLCFRYCFLFPEGYIFEKDHLVRLWMSQGYLESTDGEAAEDIGINCFEELLRRSFFQCLHIYDARERKYGIHDLFHKFAQRVAVECFRMEDSKLSYIPGNISHISLVPCAVEALEFSYLLERQSDLCTFLFIPRSASKWPGSAVHIENTIVLDDLFIKSRYLRSLDLSNTDIKELPDSIESLKSLCYLGLNNTNIRRLPNSICSLGSLQTLELQDCYFLSDLPSKIKELTKLRCLNVFKESGFISMPSGIGELRNLRTLSNFNVGKVGWHCGIGEMQNLLDLRGSLCISGLENVVSGAQANQANLKMKGYLKTLTLHWFQNDWESEVETEQNALDVIQYLQPHINLEELIIHGYFGSQFPTWLGDPLFCNLVSLALDNCYESNVLPPLGQLPSLRFLSLQKMDSIRALEFDFCGSCSEVLCRFPSLEKLKLREMSELEEWNWVRDGDFPQLRCLSISMCFKLIKLPPLNHLRELVFHCCDRLPEMPRLKSLEYLKIDGFQKLEFLSLPDDLPALKKLEINNCGRLSWLVGMSQLASVEQFKVSKCPQIHLDEQWPDNNQAVSISGGYRLPSACSFEEVPSPNEKYMNHLNFIKFCGIMDGQSKRKRDFVHRALKQVSDVSDGKDSGVTEARSTEIEDHYESEKKRRNLQTRAIEFIKGQHSQQHAPSSTISKESINMLSGSTESSFQTISTSLPLGSHSNFIKFSDAMDRQSKRKGEFLLRAPELHSGSSDWTDGSVAEARSTEIEDHCEPEKKIRNLQTRVIEFYKGQHSQQHAPSSTESK